MSALDKFKLYSMIGAGAIVVWCALYVAAQVA